MADLQKLVDELSGLTVLEAAELSKLLEEKWGVSAAAPVAVAAAAPAAGAAAAAPAEEQTEFTVILAKAGEKKINVIKEVRTITGLGLKEAKDLVEGAPKPVKESVGKDEVAKIRRCWRTPAPPWRSSSTIDESIQGAAGSPHHRPTGTGYGRKSAGSRPVPRCGERCTRAAGVFVAADERWARGRAVYERDYRSFTGRKRVRHNFGRIPEVAPMPNLIDVQRASYEAFLQMNVQPDSRLHAGLQEVFKSVFPIDDFTGRGRLEFVYYELGSPKYDVEECIQRGMTYAAPLKVILRLIVWDVDEETGARSIRDIKEQPVYMGDMPLMTDNGTFIINGTERVIVSQMHRSPGVFFDHDKGKTHQLGKNLFAARVIPYRGSWLDFEFDSKDLVYVRIDRKRKLPVTTLLYALEGAATEQVARRARGEKRAARARRSPRHGPGGDP